jgi:5-methylcytosine-specific restriction enzyme A
MICRYPGFLKKDGGKYAEVHHMIELNKKSPKTLQSWNLLVVCHFAIRSFIMLM